MGYCGYCTGFPCIRFEQEWLTYKKSKTKITAQLVERLATVQEVAGSKPQPGQNLGSFNNWGEITAFLMKPANGWILIFLAKEDKP